MKSIETIKSTNQFPVVGIGASAGGLDAFKKLIKAIPEDSGMAYVLVQHLDPSHDSLLAELLQKVTGIPVLEISDDIKVRPNHIYVIPRNKMMVANDGVLQLTPRPVTGKAKRNLPIDVFFTSLAEVHQSQAIGVVLSGTASDGTAGLKAIKDYGGITFAQDEGSAAYPSMPNSAIQAGVVDFILPPDKIPRKILEINRSMNVNGIGELNLPLQDEDVYRQIISLLRIRKGTDFSYYKQNTIRRRILRRMALNKSEELTVYLKYLRVNKQEQDILYQDLLIPVTAFFRDANSFEHLSETILPLILKNKVEGEPIRVWVAGCSTGEEAYSIAISFKELMGETPEKVQIFATDLSVPAITKARAAIYSKSEIEGISTKRMQEYFIKINSGYHIKKEIRDMCVFAVHNFLKDPPFGKMDMISCRNVLIYMEPYLQKKALSIFHYSLNTKGFLLLGKTETISGVPDLFASAVKNDKFFSRKDIPGKFMHVASQRSEENLSPSTVNPIHETTRADFQKTADDIMLSKYMPAGVIVNETLDIVNFRGNSGSYLEQSPGKPSHNLLKMAKQGLAFELRNIMYKVKKEKTTVKKEKIPFQLNGNLSLISIEAIPLLNTTEPYYLILFHEQKYFDKSTSKSIKKISGKTKKDEKDLRIEQLEKELAHTHEDMQNITEDQETANEQLQIDNEELLSTSEELQSLNEELETSKEELQSTNEELMIVNQEIFNLNEQVTESRDYAEAIVATIREPLLVLDKNLRVKTANSAYYNAFRVKDYETEGKLIYEVDNKQWSIPALRKLLEKILPGKSSFKDFEIRHTFSNLGERVMLLNARELVKEGGAEKLILLAIEDITEQRKAEEVQKEIKKRMQFIADAMPQKVWTADAEGNFDYINKTWLDYTGLSFEELKDWKWEKIIHPDDTDENKIKWQHSIDTGVDFEMEDRFLNKEGEYKWHLSRGLAFKDDDGKIKMWVGTNTEIQEQKKQKSDLENAVVRRTYELQKANELMEDKNTELENMNKELQSFTYVSSHDLQEPLRKIQSFANWILNKETKNLSTKGQDYFNRMQSSAARMQRLIEDLLAFSRVNSAERIFINTDLNDIVKEVKKELRETIAEKKAFIDTDGLCSATIIPFQFKQLLQNLISNALKFTRPGIPPRIIIKCDIENGAEIEIKEQTKRTGRIISDKHYCHIAVSDNGIGFEPHFSERIFEVFQKLHPKEQYEGTGIGLAIVKKIVENHNGVIIASVKPETGTTFDIYIPAFLKG